MLELRHTHRKNPLDPDDLLQQARDIVRRFAAELPHLRRILDTDVMAAYRGDPAAKSVDEVLLCYPGVLAVIHHRFAHLDRKSTRLNSSHVRISYAVFCLKKKNIPLLQPSR